MASWRRAAAVAAGCALLATCACNRAGPTPPGEPPSASPTSVVVSPTPTPTVTPTETSTTPADPRRAALAKAVRHYYSVTDSLFRKPNRAPYRQLQRVATDQALLAYQNEVLDLYVAKRHLTGSTELLSIDVVSLKKDGRHLEARVNVCWDVAKLILVDQRGNPIKTKRPNRGIDALRFRTENHRWYAYRYVDGKAKC